jgi:presenilin-like A22 family membrane protease
MKHNAKITLILLLLFFSAQIIGLFVINNYIGERNVIPSTGEINITWKDLPTVGGVKLERPEIRESVSYIFIGVAIIIGTILIFVLMQFKSPHVWKLWFFLAILLTLTISFGAFMASKIAFGIALALSLLRILRPGLVVQNFTELFIYGGLASIFVPIVNTFSAFMLLIIISLYDMYAVWKSKHMIKMAQFQTRSNIFAGLLIPYRLPNATKKGKHKLVKIKTAILGGGDIGFPLIFAGVMMKTVGIYRAMIIPVFVTISLALLLTKGKKNKFYPAMPFLSMGCVAGYAVMSLIGLFF